LWKWEKESICTSVNEREGSEVDTVAKNGGVFKLLLRKTLVLEEKSKKQGLWGKAKET